MNATPPPGARVRPPLLNERNVGLAITMSPRTVLAKIAYIEGMLKVARNSDDSRLPDGNAARVRNERFIERLERDLARLRARLEASEMES